MSFSILRAPILFVVVVGSALAASAAYAQGSTTPPESLGMSCNRAVMITHAAVCNPGGAYWGDFGAIPEFMPRESISACNTACQSCCDNQETDSWFFQFALEETRGFCDCTSSILSGKDFRKCIRGKVFDQLKEQFTSLLSVPQSEPVASQPTWFSALLSVASAGWVDGMLISPLADPLRPQIGPDVGGILPGDGVVGEFGQILLEEASTPGANARTVLRRFLRRGGMNLAASAAVAACQGITTATPEAFANVCRDRCNQTYRQPEEPEKPPTPEVPVTERPTPPPGQCPNGKRPGQSCSQGGKQGHIGSDCRCETFGSAICLPPPGTPCANGGFIGSDCLCAIITVIDGWPPTQGGGGHNFACPSCSPYQYY